MAPRGRRVLAEHVEQRLAQFDVQVLQENGARATLRAGRRQALWNLRRLNESEKETSGRYCKSRAEPNKKLSPLERRFRAGMQSGARNKQIGRDPITSRRMLLAIRGLRIVAIAILV